MKYTHSAGIVGATLFFAVSAAALLGACATADDGDVGAADEPDGGVVVLGRDGGGSTQPSTPANPTGTPTNDGGATGTTDAGTTDPDTGTTDPPDGGTTTPDGGGTTGACANASACPTNITDIGTLSGDTGNPSLSHTGSKSKFLKVRLSEDDSGFLAPKPLKVKFTLTSPPGANYDVFLYFTETNNQVAHIECQNFKGRTQDLGSTESVGTGWPDSQGVGGVDNGSNITVEVRFVSGTCDPAAQWSLLVEGNTQ